ncbi:MAG: exo-alpha-sialidase [Phycisphaerae bacterium]|nr:exo-alpha-sialidase [Phycisphaerae bacterium]
MDSCRYEPIIPGRCEHRDGLDIHVSHLRTVLRGSMFPSLACFTDGSVVLGAASDEEHSPRVSIRSENGGQTWRPIGGLRPDFSDHNIIELGDGFCTSIWYETKPLADRPGWYATRRWESDDQWRTVRGPLDDGTLWLPPDDFDPSKAQWFHGNTVEMPSGELIAVMQGVEKHGQGIYPFHVYLSRSEDRGRTWRFLSHVASLATIDDPDGVLQGPWRLHGPCEPCLVRLDGDRLMCVARLVNDDQGAPIGPAEDTYHDLAWCVRGDEIHPGVMRLDPAKYYAPGQPSVPLIISWSDDAGRTWSRPTLMEQARGCWPRLARSGNLVALTFGALAFPRWGNCVTFTTDGGRTWTDPINFAPFLTTGYTDIVTTGPGQFLCAFDCTPPQPWTRHTAHWVGVVDIEVTA